MLAGLYNVSTFSEIIPGLLTPVSTDASLHESLQRVSMNTPRDPTCLKISHSLEFLKIRERSTGSFDTLLNLGRVQSFLPTFFIGSNSRGRISDPSGHPLL